MYVLVYEYVKVHVHVVCVDVNDWVCVLCTNQRRCRYFRLFSDVCGNTRVFADVFGYSRLSLTIISNSPYMYLTNLPLALPWDWGLRL